MNIKLELLKSSKPNNPESRKERNENFFDLFKMIQGNKLSSDVKIFSEGVNKEHFEFKVMIYKGDVYYVTYEDRLIYNYNTRTR